jgi:alpha-2-macroglobulin
MPIQIELLYNEGDTNWTSIGTCTASIIDQQELLPSYTCPLRARHQGQYRLVAKINPTDETSYSSTINLFAYDFSGSSANDAQELKFRVEQASPLMQGEDNQLILISPFKRSRVLVAYGRSKQFKVQMVDMEEPVLKLPIKLRDIHTPAFDVTIVALDLSFVERDESKGVDLNTQVSKDQVVTLRKTFNVTEPENSSEIRLNTARKKYQPGEAVTLSLKSKKRKKLEYAIAVIDKAKLSYVDNYQDYYQPRQSELYTNLYFWDTIPSFNLIQHIGAEASIFHDVDRIMVTGSRINQSDLGPLLEDVNQNNKTPLNIRSLFKDSAAWHPSLVSDRKGKATFKFTLPDNLTTWAIFVVATDQKGQFYDQSMEIISSKDIEMRSQVPTQVVKGDQFNAQFSVINKTEETAVIQATIDRQQPSKILSTESLQLSPHQSAQIKAQIDVDSIETIKLVAHAHSHEHSDAIAAEIPVLDNIQFETIHKPFITHERLSVPVILPDTSVSDISELSISASTNSISQLKGALTYLRDYPHRCWEQQLSRAIGYAYHQQLQKRGFNLLEWEEGDLVNDTLNKSKLYQAPNGGFAFFTNENGRVSRYLSNFTATSFAWLQALGYQASEESMIELIRYQYQLINDFLRESGKREAKGKKIAPDTHYREEMSLLLASRARMAGMSSKNATQLEKPSTKSGSLDRKSRRKRSKFAKISKLNRVDKKAFVSIFAHLDKLSLSGLANLYHAALSFDVSKRPAILDAIKQKLPLSGEKLSLDNLIASGFFYGSTTSLCNTLSGMTAHSSTDEETNEQAQLEWQDRLRRTILGQKRPHGDFGSTQNNVWCIQAIVGNLEQSTQPNQLSIEFANQSHSLKVGKNESTHAFTAKLTPEPQSLHIKTEYKRPVFLDIALKYPIDTSVAKPSSHGMSIQRIYQVYRTSKWHEVTPDTRLAIGDWIKVSLKIYNPEYKRFIAVSDPNAGGLTPMSTSLLATVPGYITKDASYNSMFYQQQIAPTTSRFYADYLPKGHYQIDYFAQVTNQGRFSALPAIVEEMYDDDHKGRTAMQVLVVE